MLGIHTPETAQERVVDKVRSKAKQDGLTFPIAIDNEHKIWNAWGNSMWPSVYLIDKQGYVRYWWIGELKWEQADGEKQLRGRIEELLKE